uniref:Uncharacterized protein n=1 Tax=Physcomitrium patens TaxID=3218 RepID=A0A7I4EW22_PHYPA
MKYVTLHAFQYQHRIMERVALYRNCGEMNFFPNCERVVIAFKFCVCFPICMSWFLFLITKHALNSRFVS